MLARAEELCRARGAVHQPPAGGSGGGRVLREAAGPYDIAERLSRPGRRVAPVSVYRALDFLMELGLVHRIASRNAFVPCAHAHGASENVVFLICRTCGGIDETTSPEVESALGKTLKRAGFTPAHSILEVEAIVVLPKAWGGVAVLYPLWGSAKSENGIEARPSPLCGEGGPASAGSEREPGFRKKRACGVGRRSILRRRSPLPTP